VLAVGSERSESLLFYAKLAEDADFARTAVLSVGLERSEDQRVRAKLAEDAKAREEQQN